MLCIPANIINTLWALLMYKSVTRFDNLAPIGAHMAALDTIQSTAATSMDP